MYCSAVYITCRRAVLCLYCCAVYSTYLIVVYSTYLCAVYSSSNPLILNPILSQNNGVGWIYLIILEIVLTPNLHLERLLASPAFSPTFLLCSITAVSHVFFCLPLFLVPFTLRSNVPLRKLSIPTDTVSFCQLIYCFIQVQHLHLFFCRLLVH